VNDTFGIKAGTTLTCNHLGIQGKKELSIATSNPSSDLPDLLYQLSELSNIQRVAGGYENVRTIFTGKRGKADALQQSLTVMQLRRNSVGSS